MVELGNTQGGRSLQACVRTMTRTEILWQLCELITCTDIAAIHWSLLTRESSVEKFPTGQRVPGARVWQMTDGHDPMGGRVSSGILWCILRVVNLGQFLRYFVFHCADHLASTHSKGRRFVLL